MHPTIPFWLLRRSVLITAAPALWAAVALGLVSGCATENSIRTRPPSGRGLEEYRHLTVNSTTAILDSLKWLEQLNSQTGRCPPKVVTAFAEHVEQLQIGSIKVRARAQAIQARGEVYFQAWSSGGVEPAEAPLPPPADQMSKVRESFTRVKLASQQVGESFRPFFAGLRQLRAELESDPAIIDSEQGKKLIRKSRESGWQVLQKLGALSDELQALRPLLTVSTPRTGA